MNENNANFTPAAPNFKTLVRMSFQGLTNFPYIEEDFDALSNYGLLSKVVEYLNEVISNNNEQNTLMTNLYNAYVSLQDYVNNYFDNLDVQEEINNKLDEMVESGELTQLISRYIDPLIEEQNEEIANFKSLVNANLSSMNTEIQSVTSGSPLVASSTSEMTDTSRVYVNTTDGNWYYYDGNSWEIGGTYQATSLADNSVYSYQLNNSIIGTKYHYLAETATQLPYLSFNLLKQFDMGDLTSLGLKCKFTNNMDVQLGSGFFAIRFRKPSSSWGQGFSFTEQFPGDISPNTSIEINQTKNFTSTFTGIKPSEICFSLDMSGSKLYEYTIEDIEFYINGEKLIFGKDFTFNTTLSTQTDLSTNINFLASKDYVDGKINELNSDLSDLEDEVTELSQSIPSPEQLTNLLQYESSTKSDYYKVSCWGDSLTAGDYPTFLQSLLGNNVVVTNNGMSGEASGEIAFREGGVKLYTAENITIPATTTATSPFRCTASNGYISSFARFNENVTIDGIDGHLELTSDGFVFTRSSSGSEWVVTSGTEITCPSQTEYLDNISIFWVGRNDVAFNSYVLNSLIPTVDGMINVLSPAIKRFLIISPTTATDEYPGGQYEAQYNKVIAMENLLKLNYPKNYVDIEYYLVHDCIYDMGITPTAEDLLNMQRGTIPPSLMSDTIHPTPATREYIARYIYNEMLKRSWVIK